MSIEKLVLGTVQFGLNYGIANKNGKPDAALVEDILLRAWELGIRTLDTAAAYGDSEDVLGRTLEKLGLNGKMKIVTKLLPAPGYRSRDLQALITNSLMRLREKTLHAILFHHETEAENLPVLKCAAAEMNIRCGISLDSSDIPGVEYADLIQVPCNVFDRRFLALIRKCHAAGIEVHCRSIYLQGVLLMPEKEIPAFLAPLIPYRRQMESLAAEAGIAPAELYMRYLISIPEADGFLTGVDTVEQLEYNAAIAARGPLEPALFERITEIIPVFPENLIRPSLWRK